MGASSRIAALPRGVAIVVIAIVVLNLLDAFLTLRHIELGAVELNPLMRYLLGEGWLAFIAGKHFMVGAGAIAVASQCRRGPALDALRFVVLPVYAAIAVYQVALLGLVYT